MRRWLWSLLVVGALALLPAPQPADALPVPCVDCGSTLAGAGEVGAALEYWCRLLSVVLCPWA